MKNILKLFRNILNRRTFASGILFVVMLFNIGCDKKYDPTLKSRASDSDDTYLIWKKLELFKKGDIEPENLKITFLNKLPDRTFDEISFDGNGLINSNTNTEINYLTWYDMRQIINILHKNTWREHNNQISNNDTSVIRLQIDDIQFDFFNSWSAINPISDIIEETNNKSQLVRFWEHNFWFGCLIVFLLSLCLCVISSRYSEYGDGSNFFVRFFISIFIIVNVILCVTITYGIMAGYPWWVRTMQIILGFFAIFMSIYSILNILFFSDPMSSEEISREEGIFTTTVTEIEVSSVEALKNGYINLLYGSFFAIILCCFNYITSLFFY